MPLDPEVNRILAASGLFGGEPPAPETDEETVETDTTPPLRVAPIEPKQMGAYMSALRENMRNENIIRAVGQGEALESAIEDEGNSVFETLTTPIFDALQVGQFAVAGGARELQKSGKAWDAFKAAAAEVTNALPGFDEDDAFRITGKRPTRASFSDVLKESGIELFDPDKGGKWYAAGAGLVLDIVLDPLTYAGGIGVMKRVPGVIPFLESAKTAIGGTRAGAGLGRRFVTDFAVNQAAREGVITKEAASTFLKGKTQYYDDVQNGKVDVRDVALQLAAGMTTGERRLMGLFLDQPDRLKGVLRQMAETPEQYATLEKKMTAFSKEFERMATDEVGAGVLSPSVVRANYAAGRLPQTEKSADALRQLMDKMGYEESRRAAEVAGGAGGLETLPGFSKAKSFQSLEERIAAGVPTEMDIALLTAKRGFESVRAIATRRFADSVLSDKNIARRIDDVTEFLDGKGDIAEPFLASLKEKGYGVWRPVPAAGTERTAYVLPKVFIDELNYMDKVFTGESEARKLFNHYRDAMSLWKGYAVLSPGFHARNMMGNLFNASLGGLRNPKTYVEAWRLQRGLDLDKKIGDKTGKEILDIFKARGLKGSGVFAKDIPESVERELMGALSSNKAGRAAAARIGNDALAKAAVETAPARDAMALWRKTFGADSYALRANRWLGGKIEDNAKLALFVNQIKKGASVDDAVAHTKRYLFDYGNLSEFERDVMKSALPFYSWARFNIPLQFQSIFEKPGLYAAMTGKPIQAVESLSEDFKDAPTPDYFQEIHAVRLPVEAARGLNWAKNNVNAAIGRPTEEGVQPTFLNPNFPFQSLNHANFEQVMADMSPMLKFLPEQLGGGTGGRGYSLFLDRPIERVEGEKAEIPTLPDVDVPFLGNLQRRRVEEVVRSFLPTVGKIQRGREAAGRGQLAEQLSTEMIGVKLIGVDVERVKRAKTYKRRETLRKLKDKLREEGIQL